MRDTVLFLVSFVALFVGRAVAQEEAQRLELTGWRYTLEAPADGWMSSTFDDSDWQTGEAGFGTAGTPGARIGTVWRSSDLWIRRMQSLGRPPAKPALLVHHDEDAEIFVDGERVARLRGYTTEYVVVPLEGDAVSLKAGEHLVAAHCRQTGGGQYLDVHLIDAERPYHMPPRQAFDSPLTTPWGELITEDNVWPEYPRPQLVRSQWTNLNGDWDYAITGLEAKQPTEWAGSILVPFCIESELSGVGRLLEPHEALWYRRTFEATPLPGQRTRLNFEAVDYRCEVFVNGRSVGSHVGGSLPFSMDVSEALQHGENVVVVRVEDETGGWQLRGKQTLSPGGIWYTRVSGIWQTVWLEEVPARSIADLDIETDIATGTIVLRAPRRGEPIPGERLRARVSHQGEVLAMAEGRHALVLELDEPRLWSPGDPFLYDIEVELLDKGDAVVDRVTSYTGLREVGWIEDASGDWRFTLNGEEIFHWGPLDQGWWPDGLLTPPSDEALVFEIDFLKRAGFNMVRKHIKIEPRRYYAHCDRMGLLVWQDQPSGGVSPKWTRMAPDPEDASWEREAHEQYLRELDGMIDALDHFPSIVVWVPFNEAWGQHATLEVGRWLVARDRTRLVNVASGGNFWPVGHVADQHAYPHPAFPLDDARFDAFIKVVGEFGGHGWPVPDHVWDPSRNNWGYGGLPETVDEFEARFRRSIEILLDLKSKGIAGAVYTQTTDVEGEINGLLTYDRRVEKIPAARLHEITAPLSK
ncbi:MAG: glycoside hydrolase family 2 TIM barrel-domain containing protein [Planctomycetota bacterium]